MRIILGYLLFVILISCQGRPDSKYRKVIADTSDHRVKGSILALLDSLEYSYVKNVENSEDTSLLKFYKKSPIDFRFDSIRYYAAESSFFKTDSAIIEQLLQFSGDSSRCAWIYSPDPHSSNVRKWEFGFSNEDGAKVLIYAYIMSACGSEKRIPRSPSAIEYIINKIDLKVFSHWFKSNYFLNRYQLCEKFKHEML
ncbi:hypothetical protein [Chitinophaga arvensicola]|uniref:Lipoprotein n=1 Tax=Chitinophaga arvensicola TaxID=29529 RepID=A0A1I0S977_9BACT|nr:hypothetical protein [Chitinophaga arvensicola]SEW51582.1 hypothetical protein SAMN04488122_4340 [Chitinophaga arvensicola]